jgi:hypothetical protein
MAVCFLSMIVMFCMVKWLERVTGETQVPAEPKEEAK